MLSLKRVAVSLVAAGAIVSLSHAQNPNPSTPGQDPPPVPRVPVRRQSIVQHNPYPYPEHYYSDPSAGFRNPGGIGRSSEYYPPGGRYQNDLSGRGGYAPATFDRGGGEPSRAEQMAAQQLGVQKYNAIQSHIDNYARPYIGYGVGGFGGFY